MQAYGCTLAFCFLYICSQCRHAGLFLYLVSCSFFSVLSLSYHAFGYDFHPDLVTATLETNTTEASAFFSLQSITAFCGYMAAAWGLLYAFGKIAAPSRLQSTKSRICKWALAIVGMAACYMLPSLVFFSIPWGNWNVPAQVVQSLADDSIRWNPFFHLPNYRPPFESFSNHFRKPFSNIATLWKGLKDYMHPVPISNAAEFPSEEVVPHQDFICVLAIGESLRAGHMGFNGYARNTTPKLAAIPNLYSLPCMYSYAASTDPSFRGILTGQLTNRQNEYRTSFLSILKKHGYGSIYCTENAEEMVNTRRNKHIIGNYVDSILSLSGSTSSIAAAWAKNLPKSGKHCIILQNGTGHYPYSHDQEYTLFKDSTNNHDELVNNYDNCILAMDSLYSSIIRSLADRNAVLIYCSDHAELLGENGRWHHGDDNEPILRRVAAFIWFSDSFIAENGELVNQIVNRKDSPMVQGQLYATILRLCRISTSAPLEIGDIASDSVTNHPENNLPETIKTEITQGQNPSCSNHE